MANHLTGSQIQTLLAVTPVGNLTIGQLKDLLDATDRVKYNSVPDSKVGTSADPKLSATFPTGLNP
jgi:hypothetical protein